MRQLDSSMEEALDATCDEFWSTRCGANDERKQVYRNARHAGSVRKERVGAPLQSTARPAARKRTCSVLTRRRHASPQMFLTLPNL